MTSRSAAVVTGPDGKTLASGSADETIRLWNLKVAAWQQRACRIANRNLTAPECTQYFGNEPYHKTCPTLP